MREYIIDLTTTCPQKGSSSDYISLKTLSYKPRIVKLAKPWMPPRGLNGHTKHLRSH